jgi:hypothetical protein
MAIPPGVDGVMSKGPSVVGAAMASGAISVIFGGGGAMASTNSLGGAGGVILPNARCFGGAAARFLVLVSSALVRSPGERSAIIARKLLADETPGIVDSTPR